MDFGYLLDLAKQNEDNSKELANVKRFSTELSKAKKLERSRVKSGNVQKFLAQKDAEEKQKMLEAKQKKQNLLTLRASEKGSKRRVSAMLNRTKGANRSVLEDAKDKYNTAATVDGAYQPDEDDYGYESKASSDMYNKLLKQYEKIPDQDYLRRSKTDKGKRSLDLAATKARVKQSLDTQEEEERNMKGHRRRRKHADPSVDRATDTGRRARSPSPPAPPKPAPVEKKAKQKPSAVRRGMPPPPPGLDYLSILQLAAEKQHQPVMVAERPASELGERPLTAREKAEYEANRLRELRKQGKLPPAKHHDYNGLQPGPSGKDRKGRVAEPGRKEQTRGGGDGDAEARRDRTGGAPAGQPKRQLPPGAEVRRAPSPAAAKRNTSPPSSSARRKASPPTVTSGRKPSPPPASYRRRSSPPSTDVRRKASPPPAVKRKQPPSPEARRKQPPSPEARRKQPPSPEARRKQPPTDLKSKQFPPVDLKPKQFPPADTKRKQFRPENMQRFSGGSAPKRQRIESSDSEYDSEMDDFIDDGPAGGENEYSSAIREIFGYDKNKYRDADEDVDDMEANFSTLMREEAASARLAVLEDEREYRKEMEHKKRKLAMKRRADVR